MRRVSTHSNYNYNDSRTVPLGVHSVDEQQRRQMSEHPLRHEMIAPSVVTRHAAPGVLDLYTEGETIGEGQFGVVFVGKHKLNGKEYAVKKIHRSNMIWNNRDNLRSEISALESVRDGPHIVRLYNHYMTSDHCFLLMELMKGGSLFDLIIEKQVFTEKEARDVIECLLKAVRYMHMNRVVHRDIKPENLLLEKPMSMTRVKIADFGFAKRVVSHNCCRTLCGTPGYMAPEILEPWPAYGVQCDMWSIGVILFLLLGGFLPFDDDDDQMIYRKTRNASFEFDPRIFGHVSMDAKKLVTRLLTIDPAKRLSADQAMEHEWMKRDGSHLQEKQLNADKLQETRVAKAKLRKVVNVINLANRLKGFDKTHKLAEPNRSHDGCFLGAAKLEGSETGKPLSHFYSIGKTIGKGGFSAIYQAKHKVSKESYAVKRVDISLADHRRVIEDEIIALKFLRGGPHIIQLHDVFREDSAVFMVLDEMRGGNVLERICEKQVYSEREARNMCKSLFEAINYMHKRKVAHRDLKPENILLVEKNNDTTIKVADFGFAKMVHEEKCLRTLCGTPLFVAPEIVDFHANGYDESVDMWSIGVVVYILLGGYAPFEEQDEELLFSAILQGKYEFHTEYWSHISVEAKNMIVSLLQVDPQVRASAEVVLQSEWMTAEGETLSANDLSTAQHLIGRSLPINKFRGAVKATIAAGKFGFLGESSTISSSQNNNAAHQSPRNGETYSGPRPERDRTFATVYRIGAVLQSKKNHDIIAATDKQSGFRYDAKCIHRKNLNPKTAVALQDEIVILNSLKGCHFVTGLHDVIEEPDAIYVVLERTRHESLLDRMLNKNMICYTEYDAHKLFANLLIGILYCHNRRIAHRDLSMENIELVSGRSDTDIKISNFSCSKKALFPNSLRTVCGTQGYFAPEIVAHKPAYDTKCDMWSLGVILYTILGGYRPFRGTWDEQLMNIRYGNFEFHEKYWANISGKAKNVVSALLTVDPDLRINATEALTSSWITSFDEV